MKLSLLDLAIEWDIVGNLALPLLVHFLQPQLYGLVSEWWSSVKQRL